MKILFYIHHLYYLPQFLPVARFLSRRHEVGFGHSDKATPREMDVLKREILNAGWACYPPSLAHSKAKEADVLFVGTAAGIENLAGPSSLVVLMFHSIGMKSIYYSDTHPRIDIRFIDSDYHRNRCLEIFPELNIHTVGFAKLDPLISGELTTDDRLPKGNGPNILYAPTFYPGSLELVGHEIPAWPREWQIAVKPHQFTYTNPFYRYQRVLLEDLAKKYPNVTLLPLESYNVLTAFQWADLLVSEISSTILEFTVLDRPIVICDEVHLRWHHRWQSSHYFQRRVDQELLSLLDFTHHARSAAEVAEQIGYALTHSQELSERRKVGRDLLVGPSDGHASKRIMEIIDQAKI